MERYSSNLTLFYVVFLPVFWWTVFGIACIVMFIMPLLDIDIVAGYWSKLFSLIMLILGTVIFFLFNLRLKRIEADTNELYVTNYFTHLKMSLSNIERVVIYDLFFIRYCNIHLVQKGVFGKNIRCIERENRWEIFCLENGIPVSVNGKVKVASENS